MKNHRNVTHALTTLIISSASFNALAGSVGPELPGPGIFALLALGVVGAIGISRLRK